MSVFKCKMCGGTIEFEQGATVGVCDSCGTKQTLPRLDDDKKINLYDRANHFRRNNDYDKAMGIYEQILNEDNTDAEAYWSLVLCRYGIEYVEDPKSHKRIPTVNRAQFTSIYMDEDYRSALQHADSYQRQIYEEEAKAIDDIQKGILDISSKEEPFDVFICYKETDANGRRTQDSVLANDLYHQLTQEGFKVFFARITLEDKLGTAYEPYIFAALNSAKVMVVLGTRPEYFNAVWVRNEWSRYLSLIKHSHGKKILIPAYKDMDPYDLPEEFSHLQAQDMSKLGFMQDLIRGIGKIVTAGTPKAVEKSTVVVNNESPNTAPLLRRAFLFLEDENWQEADEYCEKVLDQDPENAEAYLGKLMAELKVRKQEQFKNCRDALEISGSYQKVLRFGSEELREALKGYNQYIINRNENERLTGLYNDAVIAMNEANTEEAYTSAAEMFQSIGSFMDAGTLAEKCLDKAGICLKDAIYNDAYSMLDDSHCQNGDDHCIKGLEESIKKFGSISGWKDADEQILVCQRKIEEIKAKQEAERLERERKAEERRIAEEKAAKRRKKAFAIGTPTAVVCIAFLIVLTKVIIPENKYNSAIKHISNGEIVDAYESLVSLDGYKDSAQKAAEIFNIYKTEKLKAADVGDIVYFGKYEQDNDTSNGKENIEWQVLAKEDNRMLLISDKALDCKRYSTNYNATWESSVIRAWLNDTFLNEAFNTAQKAMVCYTNTSVNNDQEYTAGSDGKAADRLFLLSIDEAQKYLKSDEDRLCVPTKYAVAQGAYESNTYMKKDKYTTWWWLRKPYSSHFAKVVHANGLINSDGESVTNTDISVRPALWIELES